MGEKREERKWKNLLITWEESDISIILTNYIFLTIISILSCKPPENILEERIPQNPLIIQSYELLLFKPSSSVLSLLDHNRLEIHKADAKRSMEHSIFRH